MKKSVTRRFICLFIACCNLLFLFGCSNPVEDDESSLPPQSSTSDTSPPDTSIERETPKANLSLTYTFSTALMIYFFEIFGANRKINKHAVF